MEYHLHFSNITLKIFTARRWENLDVPDGPQCHRTCRCAMQSLDPVWKSHGMDQALLHRRLLTREAGIQRMRRSHSLRIQRLHHSWTRGKNHLRRGRNLLAVYETGGQISLSLSYECMVTWVWVASTRLTLESSLSGVFDLKVIERDRVCARIFALSRVGWWMSGEFPMPCQIAFGVDVRQVIKLVGRFVTALFWMLAVSLWLFGVVGMLKAVWARPRPAISIKGWNMARIWIDCGNRKVITGRLNRSECDVCYWVWERVPLGIVFISFQCYSTCIFTRVL
jgi:hypothetical protein